MASAEDNSIGGSGSVQSEDEAKSETGTSTAIKTSIYQELDDAFLRQGYIIKQWRTSC